MVRDTVLYDRLEIPPTASDTEIKKSFLRLSKLWHPDKHPDEKKEETSRKFQDIQQAKEILSDTEQRAQYDQIGMDIFNQQQQQQQQQGGFPGGFPAGFAGFHGFPSGFPGMNQQQQQPLEEIVVNLTVSLEDVHNQRVVSVTYPCKHVCDPCKGEGTKSGSGTCVTCNGAGKRIQIIQMGPMIQQQVHTCNPCRGTGRFIDEKNRCATCEGSGVTTRNKTRGIPLKSGLETGHKIYMQGKGHYLKAGRSDLILVMNVKPHPLFHRFGIDLLYCVDLTLYQALFGFNKLIVHMDGRKLHLMHIGKTEPNTVRCLPMEGLTKLDTNTKGSMYILFNVKLPEIPPSAVNEWRKSLQRLDEQELNAEKRLERDMTLTKVVPIAVQDAGIWLSRYYTDESDHTEDPQERHQQQQQQHQQRHQQGQPGCAQQ